ncbi:MAG: T9SS type A sorting domain-containing protein, partial [Bacteroidota bacterium]
CAGTSVTLSGSGASTYAWNNGVTNAVAFTPSTTQTYTVTGTDANGCTNSAQVQVAVNALPIVSAGLPLAVCQGSSVILYGSGAQTYTWNNGVQNAVSFIPTFTQTYTVVGTNQNGCQGSAQVVVTVNPTPSVSGGANQTICSGASATLSGTGASTYVWSGGVQNGVPFVPQGNQTYTVTGTSAAGCQGTAQVTITVVNNPVVSAGANQTVCPGSQVTLTGSGATTYVWSNGVQNGVPFVPTSTQTYTVTGTLNGGCSSTAQVTVTVSTPPNVNAGSNVSICLGDSVILNASGASTYSWSGGIQNGMYFTPIATQTYTVTGVDALGCSNSDAVTVTVNQATSSTLTTTACNSYILNGQTYSQSGTYTQVIPNALGCDSTITLNLTINVPPVIPVITAMNGVTLVSSTQENVSYQWIFCNSGLPIANATDTSYTTTINGNFAVQVINGCGTVTSNCIEITNVGITSLNQMDLVLYPNPTLDNLTVGGINQPNLTFAIKDVTGRIVKAGQFTSMEPTLNVKDLVNGVYWMTIPGYKAMEFIKQ